MRKERGRYPDANQGREIAPLPQRLQAPLISCGIPPRASCISGLRARANHHPLHVALVLGHRAPVRYAFCVRDAPLPSRRSSPFLQGGLGGPHCRIPIGSSRLRRLSFAIRHGVGLFPRRRPLHRRRCHRLRKSQVGYRYPFVRSLMGNKDE